jgi:hypothetical protein
MLGTRWIRFTRKNQVKSIPIQKLCTAIINCGPQMFSGSFWKKNIKIADRNFKMLDRNFWAGSANFIGINRF